MGPDTEKLDGRYTSMPGGCSHEERDDGWVSFDTSEPEGPEIVQQYLGLEVIEHSNPPDWAFPTARWGGKRDDAATHWRYVDAPGMR